MARGKLVLCFCLSSFSMMMNEDLPEARCTTMMIRCARRGRGRSDDLPTRPQSHMYWTPAATGSTSNVLADTSRSRRRPATRPSVNPRSLDDRLSLLASFHASVPWSSRHRQRSPPELDDRNPTTTATARTAAKRRWCRGCRCGWASRHRPRRATPRADARDRCGPVRTAARRVGRFVHGAGPCMHAHLYHPGGGGPVVPAGRLAQCMDRDRCTVMPAASRRAVHPSPVTPQAVGPRPHIPSVPAETTVSPLVRSFVRSGRSRHAPANDRSHRSSHARVCLV